MDNWRGVTESALTRMGRKYTQDLSMGVGHDRRHPDYPGIVAERYTSGEQPAPVLSPLGAVYERRQLEDIPLEPKSMDYEGTATLRG